MGARIKAIFLFVIGGGIALYFFTSGGASKLLTFVAPPGSSTSTPASTTSTVATSTTPVITSSTGSTTGPTATSTKPASSSSGGGNFFTNFFNLIFHPKPLVLPGVVGSAGGGSNTGSGSAGGGGGGTLPSQPSGSTNPATQATSTIPANQIPKGYTIDQLSPYFHLVKFNGVGVTQIGITAPGGSTSATTTIDITGWQIKTNRGGEFIPQAVNIYDPSAAAILNDIYLVTRRNDMVYLYSNSAPVNLRLNKCMGFLTATKQFNPALPSGCPSVNRDDISAFSGQCQNYIMSLGCRQADLSSTQIPRYDVACQDYLKNNFSYKSCISSHGSDKDFLSNTWRVWMGSSPLDKYHDNVVLLDRKGLVVDTYSY